MLKIVVPGGETYNNETNSFEKLDQVELHLEHSLEAISKWEAMFHKSFIETDEKTSYEWLMYIKCMTLDDLKDLTVYERITEQQIKTIFSYINDSMTATNFYSDPEPGSHERVTSELIYYWMIGFNIPFSCDKWHIDRLLTLIQLCNRKANPKKMSMNEMLSKRNALNEERKARFHSKG